MIRLSGVFNNFMLELEMVSAHGCMGVFFFQNSILDE